MVAIAFPTTPGTADPPIESDPKLETDNQYTFQGTVYVFDNLNNRWLAQESGGGSITVSDQKPPEASANQGDLWWYCGAEGEDPRLFTLVEDVNMVKFWMDSSPGIAFEGVAAGGTSVGAAPTSLDAGALFYRYDETDPDNTATFNKLYISLGDGVYREIAAADPANDLEVNQVATTPTITDFVGTPTMTFTADGTADISALADDQWVLVYAVGGGGGGHNNSPITIQPGGGGGAAIVALPKVVLGDTITVTVGQSGSGGGSGTAGSGTASILSFSGPQADVVAGGGFGGSAFGGGGGGTGMFLWPDDDGIYSREAGAGTSVGVADLPGNNLRGGGGANYSSGGSTNLPGGNSVFGGGGGASGASQFGGVPGTSTYATTFGHGGNSGGSGTDGFVRLYFPR